MKKKMKWTYAFLLAVVLAASVNAQNSFDAFWVKFKAAVERGDKAAVVKMTKFPFSLGYDPSVKGDEAFLRTAKSFMRRYTYIFNGEVDAKKCFASDPPEKEETGYYVACSFKTEPAGSEKPFIYSFTLTKQGWRFGTFENINE